MAVMYPYISGTNTLVKAFDQLRSGFPPKVDAAYLKRTKLAPSNESYLINILRFLGIIDEDGTGAKTDLFYGSADKFQAGLDALLRDAYKDVFAELGDAAFTKERDDLAHWFRGADRTSALVGTRQASTFQTIAALAGHGELPSPRSNGSSAPRDSRPAARSSVAKARTKAAEGAAQEVVPFGAGESSRGGSDVGLTVRIEVNLPAGGEPETYDAIFASIKRHLIP